MSKFEIFDSEIVIAKVLAFQGKYCNTRQETAGPDAGKGWVEFVDDDKDETLDQAKYDAWKKEWEARPDESHIEPRKYSYPSVFDQLDMIYRAGQGGDEFQAAIKAVKDKYPKKG